MAGLYIEPDMEGIHGFNRRNQEEDFFQQFRAWSLAEGRREVTSRMTPPWDPPVIETKRKKRRRGALVLHGLQMGRWLARAWKERRWAKPNRGEKGRLGLASYIFLTETFSSF